jgi:hypothetical protein
MGSFNCSDQVGFAWGKVVIEGCVSFGLPFFGGFMWSLDLLGFGACTTYFIVAGITTMSTDYMTKYYCI